MGEGGLCMEKSVSSVEKTQRMKCPECLNYMIAHIHDNGGMSGTCPVCKARVYSRQHTPKERLIRIVKQ